MPYRQQDIEYMQRAIALAKKGAGFVNPNPMVGCVVVKDNEIIAEGYHEYYGGLHAERNALTNTSADCKDATLYVTLEPCCHHGKTPPCTDIIIEKGIKKVVVGLLDPNPLVSGKGISILQNAGIEVVTGVLEEEGLLLNRVFFKNILEQKPYIVTKTATTIDGKTATKTGDSKWITSSNSRKLVKKFRKYCDAILTTSSTVLADNPEMKHSKKIILDRTGKLDFGMQIFKQGEIILVTSQSNIKNIPINVQVVQIPELNNKLHLEFLFKKLFTLGIKSIFVEAGAKLNGDLVKNNLVDEVIHFVAPKILNDNTGMSCFDGDNIELIADSKEFKLIELKRCSPDFYARYLFTR